MRKIILIAVMGVLAAGMIAAGSGTKASDETDREPLKAEGATVKQSKKVTGNILADADVYEVDVLTGANVVNGVRGEITVNKNGMETVTNEQFKEFAENTVAGHGYSWFTIFFEDDTGICFEGALSYCATYGTVDYDGTIIEAEGTIMLGGDGKYVYTEIEE